jgi:hypothetical protein
MAERQARCRTAVDFEIRDSDAIGIYPLAGAGIDVAALSTSPAVAKARSLATGTLASRWQSCS